MARYIDADALESQLFRDGIAGIFLNYPRRTKFTIGEIRGMLKNERIAPTADVVPADYVKQLKHDINHLKKYDAERDIKLHAGLISRTEEKIALEVMADVNRYFNKEISFYKDQHFAASLGYDKERCRYCEHIIAKLEQHKQHFTELLKKYIGEQNDGRN